MYRTSNEALKAMMETGDRILVDLATELLAARAVVEAVPALLQDYEYAVDAGVEEEILEEEEEESARDLVKSMDALLVAHEKASDG